MARTVTGVSGRSRGGRHSPSPSSGSPSAEYDSGAPELLPYLKPEWRDEVARAVTHLGLIGAVRRLAPYECTARVEAFLQRAELAPPIRTRGRRVDDLRRWHDTATTSTSLGTADERQRGVRYSRRGRLVVSGGSR